jgi:GTP cyclohydrolase I
MRCRLGTGRYHRAIWQRTTVLVIPGACRILVEPAERFAHSERTMPKRQRAAPKSHDSTTLTPPTTQPRTQNEIAAAEAHVRGILRFLGEDPKREGLQNTPARVVRAMAEHFSGYGQDPGMYLAKTFQEVDGYDELVLVSDIEVYSHCEHHMVPFVGKAHIAYIPDGRVVGLSKLARVVDVFAKRLQVQEKLTKQIADAIQGHLMPQGVAVIMQCQHFCLAHGRPPASCTGCSWSIQPHAWSC